MKEVVQKLVDHFGTQEKTAKAIGVHQSNISRWLDGEYKISAANAIKAERVTNGAFKKEQLCPQVFAVD